MKNEFESLIKLIGEMKELESKQRELMKDMKKLLDIGSEIINGRL